MLLLILYFDNAQCIVGIQLQTSLVKLVDIARCQKFTTLAFEARALKSNLADVERSLYQEHFDEMRTD